ncbi:MAG: thioredoxin domain-containing protein [Bryobacteraceae bacterium]|nr:thioredoxin domain-containing protein [Bryobacteraceae bacterium]
MARRRTIQPETFEDWVREFATRNKLDAARAAASLNDPALAAAVEAEFQEGVARGIARTPTALVNGVPFIETFTVEEISQGIDQALKEHGIQ